MARTILSTDQTLRELLESLQSKRKLRGAPVNFTMLADMAGISRFYLYKLMNGESEPSDAVIRKMAYGWGFTQKLVYEACLNSRRAA